MKLPSLVAAQKFARPIKDKSMTLFADAGRFPKAEELQKPSR